MKVLFCVQNQAGELPGGRYHALMLALAIAEIGHKVTFATNTKPMWFDDVAQYFDLSNFKILIDRQFGYSNGEFKKYDLFIGAPTLGGCYATGFGQQLKRPAIAMVFESPLWWTRVSGSRASGWRGWDDYEKALTQRGCYILDTTKEGSKFTQEWLKGKVESNKFLQLYAPINNRAIAKVNKSQLVKKNQIVFISRLVDYKNWILPLEVAASHPSKPKAVFISGYALPEDKDKITKTAKKMGVESEFLPRLSELDKFKVISESKLLVHGSLFEGLGLPPIEAAYCLVPCVIYDLPVYREVHTYGQNGETFVTIAKRKDKDDFIKKCGEILDGKQPQLHRNELNKILVHYKRFASIEGFEENVETILEQVA